MFSISTRDKVRFLIYLSNYRSFGYRTWPTNTYNHNHRKYLQKKTGSFGGLGLQTPIENQLRKIFSNFTYSKN